MQTNNTPPTQTDAQQPSFEGLDGAICSAFVFTSEKPTEPGEYLLRIEGRIFSVVVERYKDVQQRIPDGLYVRPNVKGYIGGFSCQSVETAVGEWAKVILPNSAVRSASKS